MSTAHRFKIAHHAKLKLDCGVCEAADGAAAWKGRGGPDLYRAIFAASAEAGTDVYGIGAHFDSWAHAQRAQGASWPRFYGVFEPTVSTDRDSLT